MFPHDTHPLRPSSGLQVIYMSDSEEEEAQEEPMLDGPKVRWDVAIINIPMMGWIAIKCHKQYISYIICSMYLDIEYMYVNLICMYVYSYTYSIYCVSTFAHMLTHDLKHFFAMFRHDRPRPSMWSLRLRCH